MKMLWCLQLRWVSMGMPQDLLPPAQVAQLKAASELETLAANLSADGKSVSNSSVLRAALNALLSRLPGHPTLRGSVAHA